MLCLHDEEAVSLEMVLLLPGSCQKNCAIPMATPWTSLVRIYSLRALGTELGF